MSAVTAVVDFGSSHTVTVVHVPGRAPRLVTVDGEPWLPSAVFLSRDDQLVVGQDALRMAAADPARLESRAKARILEREVLLGDTVLPVTTLVRAVLARVVRAAAAVADAPVDHLVLTHPAGWDEARLAALLSAAAGVAPRISTLAEPVGAAAWFATQGTIGVDGAERLPVGGLLAVLDLGGGTCDVSVVRREPTGIEVIGAASIPDLGGGDFDQRIVDHLRATVPGLADRLVDASAPGRVSLVQLRELVAFRREVRRGKELLSRHERVELALPEGLPDTELTRADLESVLGPDLDRVTAFTLRTIIAVGVEPTELTAVQLVGGSARIPLLRTLLAEVVPAPIRLDDQPEAVVALGACAVAVSHTDPEPAFAPEPPTVATPVAVSPSGPPSVLSSASPSEPSAPVSDAGRRRSRLAPAVLAVVVLLAVGLVIYGYATPPGTVAGVGGASEERVTLPAAERGEELVSAGDPADGLVSAQLGAPVRMFDGTTDIDWTVTGVLDPATEDMVAAGAPRPSADARWVLVDTTVTARQPAAAPYYQPDSYLLDDRGLLIKALRGVSVPSSCPTVPPALAAGEQTRQCLAFLVSARTPVRAVVISKVAGAGGQQFGVRVDLPAEDVVPGRAPEGRTVPLGTLRPLRVGKTPVRAAVVDVVTRPSAYAEDGLPDRPGSRTVLVRAVAEVEGRVAVGDLTEQLLLRDDRYQPITARALSERHGCAAGTASGRIVVCALYVVPAGVPITSVAWSGDDANMFFWRLP